MVTTVEEIITQSVIKTETLTKTVTSTYIETVTSKLMTTVTEKEIVKEVDWLITTLVEVALILIGLGIRMLMKLRKSK